VYFFLSVPLAILVLFSFNASKSRGNWGGFSLKWYGEMFSDPNIMSALSNTVTIAVLAAVLATIIGSAAAIGMFYMKKLPQAVIMNISYLPVLNPDIVTGVALMFMFAFIKMPFGYGTLLLAHISFDIPYVILSVQPKLKQLDPNTVEAANDLGAGDLYAFWHIVLPQIMPGVINGLLLAFALSIDDFVISFFTTGPGVSNISIYVYSMTKTGVKPTMNALSTILFVSVLAILLIVNARTSESEKRKV
jgi:spermidine/putrescine transport system permease protein